MDAIVNYCGTSRSPPSQDNQDSRQVIRKSLSPSRNTCSHSLVLKGFCVCCRQNMNGGFGYYNMFYGLRSSNPGIGRLKEINSNKLFSQRKLHLVLDLDHTLLHSQFMNKLTHEEEYLKSSADCLQTTSNGSLFKFNDDEFLVKLRPYLRTFLKQVSRMFELHIYTMGSRFYAEQMAILIDPNCEYNIKSRIISRDDSKNIQKKSLDLVLGQERGIVILDDTESVWNDHKENLIVMGKYNYFADERFNSKSYSQKKTDESETNGVLANVLEVLKKIHGLFFENTSNLNSQDVRTCLRKIRTKILMGCTLFFNDVGGDLPIVWRSAGEMGATCKTILDSSVTHVVALNKTMEDCQWAKQENKFLVHPRWIYAAYYLWHKQPEEMYLPF